MKWNHVRIPIVVSVCLTALLPTRPRTDSPDLSGIWLTTLVFPGLRPMQVAITFEATSSASSEGQAQGRWTMVGNNEFLIAFRLAGDPNASSDLQYRVTGALKLDRTLGRLRGPISCDVSDANGSVIATVEGAARARRISLNHKPE